MYKAAAPQIESACRAKMILAGSSADPRVVQRFLFEAEVLARVQHPQVVQVFEVDTYQGPNGVPIPYLAMELLEGGSLSRKLKTHSAEVGNARWLTPHAAAELVEGLARRSCRDCQERRAPRLETGKHSVCKCGTWDPERGTQNQN